MKRKLIVEPRGTGAELQGVDRHRVFAAIFVEDLADWEEADREMLGQIVPNIAKTSDLVQEITAGSKEQSAEIDQLNTEIQRISQITKQNASASVEMAATAEELGGQAELLQSLVSFFQVPGGS